MKTLLTFLFLSISLPIFSQTETQSQTQVAGVIDSDESEEPWIGPVTTEVKFKGEGKLTDFINDSLSKDLKYYLAAKKIKGKMFCTLLIDKTGKVKEVKIVKGNISPYVDKEVKRVLELTSWEPAICNNNPVYRKVMIPVVF